MRLLPFALIGALAGCAAPSVTVLPATTTGAPMVAVVPSSPLERLAQFTLVDLQNADADAVAHKDVIAHACYPALMQFVQEQSGALGGNTVSGAFSAFQKGRDLAHSVDAGIPDYLKLGCAPLVVDVQVMVARLAAIGAGAAATGGASILVPTPFPIQ